MRSVELFAGAGGLALGCELAGFEPAAVVEWDRWACDTVRQNRAKGYPLVQGWDNLIEGDVRGVDWSGITDVDLVAGGPPCQPFSMGGKHRAHDDKRDMFPATAEVVAKLRPKAFLIENVKGLTRATFANYFQYILLRMEMPEVVARDGETWFEHLKRLQAEHTGSYGGLKYNVTSTVVNAADYGVPQQRHRVFIVGFRSDLDAEWSFPDATHSLDALLYDQWVTGAYWDRHQIPERERPEPPKRSATRIAALRDAEPAGLLLPWRTVRDAISDLPEPGRAGTKGYLNHRHQPGARPYPGHTGSPLDMPSKALKAGGHGVPGGENMLVRLDGSVRYYSVREAARIQTFPDRYELHGAWGEAMRQLGNAVPVLLAQKVAGSVAEHIVVADARKLAASMREVQELLA